MGPPDGSGYHPILSLFQTIHMHDTVTLSPAIGNKSRVQFMGQSVPDRNTCTDLLSALSPYMTQFWSVTVQKAIPSGAGLGGASSDAATLLGALLRHAALDLTDQQTTSIAASVGCDVPFFLTGGPCVVSGYGEGVTPSTDPRSYYSIVLMVLPIQLSTPSVYAMADRMGVFDRLDQVDPLHPSTYGHNGLLQAARAVSPEFATLYDRLMVAFPDRVCMSGSGSTLFILTKSEDDESRVLQQATSLLADDGATVQSARPWP